MVKRTLICSLLMVGCEREGERIDIRPVTLPIPYSAFLIQVLGVADRLVLTGAGRDSYEDGVVEFWIAVFVALVFIPLRPLEEPLMKLESVVAGEHIPPMRILVCSGEVVRLSGRKEWECTHIKLQTLRQFAEVSTGGYSCIFMTP